MLVTYENVNPIRSDRLFATVLGRRYSAVEPAPSVRWLRWANTATSQRALRMCRARWSEVRRRRPRSLPWRAPWRAGEVRVAGG